MAPVFPVKFPAGAESTDVPILSALRRSHEGFASGVRFAHVPRAPYLKRLDEHVASDDFPLLVQASSGAGKSALVAYWASEHGRKHPEAFIVEHYVGCGEGAADHHDLIRHVMLEIRERFAVSAELPTTPEGLVRDFSAWLWYAREPMTLVIDGLDLLPEESRGFEWMPEVVPARVRLIATATDECSERLSAVRGWNRLKLKPLTLAERRKAVRQYMTGRGVSLPPAQLQSLETDRGSANPLLLRTRLDEAHAAAGGGDLKRVIDYYLGAASLDEMYGRLLGRLEDEFGREVVREFFSILCVARNGLSPDEIEGLSGLSGEFVPLLGRLDFHLGRRGALLHFHHDALRQAAMDRYLSEEKALSDARSRVARYFIDLPPTQHTASEAAFQLRQLSRWPELADLLTRVPVMTALYENETKYEYLTYWQVLENHVDVTARLRESLDRYRRREPEPAELVKGLKTGGDICHITGRWDVALELFEEMLDLSGGLDDGLQLAEAYSRVGTVLWNQGRMEEAEEKFEKARAEAESAGNELLLATIRGNLGNLYFTKGDFGRAAGYHEENLRAAERLGNSHDVCRVSGNLGSAYMRLGEYEKARECFRRMRGIARRNNDVGRLAAAEGNLGNLHYERGNYSKALRCFRRQYAIAAEVGIVQQTATAVGQMGNVFFRQGKLDRALQAYRRQRSLSGKLKDQRSYAAVTGNIGLIYAEKGEFGPAVQWYRAALALYRRTGNAHGVALMFGRLGDLMVNRGKLSQALDLYGRQLRLAERIGNRPLVTAALAKRARAHHLAGEGDVALRTYETMHGEAERLENREMQAHALIGMAQTLADADDLPRALANLEAAESIGRRHAMPHIVEQVAEERRRIEDTIVLPAATPER